MSDDPKVGLWETFLQLPSAQQLAVLGIAGGILVFGVAAGRYWTGFKIEKVEAEKAGLQNKIDRLTANLEEQGTNLPQDLPDFKKAPRDARSLQQVQQGMIDLNKSYGLSDTGGDFMANSNEDLIRVSKLNVQYSMARSKYIGEMIGKRFTWSITPSNYGHTRIDGTDYFTASAQSVFIDPMMSTQYLFEASKNTSLIEKFIVNEPIVITGVLVDGSRMMDCTVVEK